MVLHAYHTSNSTSGMFRHLHLTSNVNLTILLIALAQHLVVKMMQSRTTQMFYKLTIANISNTPTSPVDSGCEQPTASLAVPS